MVVRSLTIHADYQCRHAGDCCRAPWPIPIDPVLQQKLGLARAERRLKIPVRAPAATGCIYYEPLGDERAGRCAIHRQLGEEYKPSSCRHFPRIALVEPRGVSITLSHYCPTAASTLFRTDVKLAITDYPQAFPASGEYEGLDATSVLPPLLRPGMLWDFDGYGAWEQEAVRLLARDDVAPGHAIEWLSRIAAAVEEWQPAHGSLADHVRRAFARVPHPPYTVSEWGDNTRVVNRYLAARLFATWVPYKADRLSATVDHIARAYEALQEEAARPGVSLHDSIRATDLRIVHAGC